MAITFCVTFEQDLTKNVPVGQSEINAFVRAELAKPGNVNLLVEAEWNGIVYPSKYSKEGVERLEPHTKNSLK